MDNSRKEIVNSIFLILQVGICMIVSVALGAFLGYLVGKWLDADYMILLGLVLGIAAGYQNVYHMIKKFMKNPKLPETVQELSKEDLKRKQAEEEFERWKQERNSDDN